MEKYENEREMRKKERDERGKTEIDTVGAEVIERREDGIRDKGGQGKRDRR